MMKNNIFFLLYVYILFYLFSSHAAPINLPIPRFVSIKFNEVNARKGPEYDCPIEWVFIKKGEPVEVIAEYGYWRKIRDIEGEGGWVHSSVISGRRSVVVKSDDIVSLLTNPDIENGKIVAKLQPRIRCDLEKCKRDWCKLNCSSYKGWVEKKFLWGV